MADDILHKANTNLKTADRGLKSQSESGSKPLHPAQKSSGAFLDENKSDAFEPITEQSSNQTQNKHGGKQNNAHNRPGIAKQAAGKVGTSIKNSINKGLDDAFRDPETGEGANLDTVRSGKNALKKATGSLKDSRSSLDKFRGNSLKKASGTGKKQAKKAVKKTQKKVQKTQQRATKAITRIVRKIIQVVLRIIRTIIASLLPVFLVALGVFLLVSLIVWIIPFGNQDINKAGEEGLLQLNLETDEYKIYQALIDDFSKEYFDDEKFSTEERSLIAKTILCIIYNEWGDGGVGRKLYKWGNHTEEECKEYVRKVNAGEVTADEFAADPDGFGMMQFYGSHRRDLIEIAKEKGSSVDDVYVQLEALKRYEGYEQFLVWIRTIPYWSGWDNAGGNDEELKTIIQTEIIKKFYLWCWEGPDYSDNEIVHKSDTGEISLHSSYAITDEEIETILSYEDIVNTQITIVGGKADIAKRAREFCSDDSHGYSLDSNHQCHSFTDPNKDLCCASFVCVIYNDVYPNSIPFNSGVCGLEDALKKDTKNFVNVTDKIDPKTTEGMEVGDIIIWRSKTHWMHTQIYIGNKQVAEASYFHGHPETGDQGGEVTVNKYYNNTGNEVTQINGKAIEMPAGGYETQYIQVYRYVGDQYMFIWPTDKHKASDTYHDRVADGTYDKLVKQIGSAEGISKFHRGIDVDMPKGAPVYAMADGVVKKKYSSENRGVVIVIKHDNGYWTLYEHLDPAVKVNGGEYVKQGDIIANIGTTGKESGTCLHFELYPPSVSDIPPQDGWSSEAIDPMPYLAD